MRHRPLLIATLMTGLLLNSGCVYRIDIPQGNVVEQKQVEMLRVGMSRAQVEYVLGSPMVEDTFTSSNWYYIYYLREGWHEPKQKQLIAHFDGDKLVSITGDFPAPKAFTQPL